MAELSIFGVIGWDVWPEDVRDALSYVNPSDPLKIDLHSPGGDYPDGVAIFSLLDRRSGRNEVEVVGEAGSMASFIAMAGDRRVIREAGTFYVHRPWSFMVGYEDELVAEADILRRLATVMHRVYMRGFNGTAEELTEKMAGNGTLYTAEEAVESGLLHEIAPARESAKNEDRRDREAALRRAAFSKPADSSEFLRAAATMPEVWTVGGREGRERSRANLRQALESIPEADGIEPAASCESQELSRIIHRMSEHRNSVQRQGIHQLR